MTSPSSTVSTTAGDEPERRSPGLPDVGAGKVVEAAVERRLSGVAVVVDDQGCTSTQPRPSAINWTRLGRQSVSIAETGQSQERCPFAVGVDV